MRTITVPFCLLLVLTLLSGCGSLETTNQESPEKLTNEALEAFRYGDYHEALELFTEIKEKFPFSRFSLLAELKSADANFYLKNYAEARALYEEFEEKHPTNEAIPYVLFQIARCHYTRIDAVDRDTSGAKDAINTLNRLLKAYPNSPYTAQAKVMIADARSFLARHELFVANFYIRTEEPQQAIGRLEYLLTNYPETEAAGKAGELLRELKSEATAQ